MEGFKISIELKILVVKIKKRMNKKKLYPNFDCCLKFELLIFLIILCAVHYRRSCGGMNCFGTRRRPRRAALINALDEIGFDAYLQDSDSEVEDEDEPLLRGTQDHSDEDLEENVSSDSNWLLIAADGSDRRSNDLQR